MNADRRAPNRLPPRISQLLNPVWMLSDDERNPNWSWWQWFKRNPFYNFLAVVVGVADCHRTVYWRHSPWTLHPDGGWNYGYTIIDGGFIPLPFVSWRGKRIEASIGWKSSGVFSITLRRANSPNAEHAP